MTHQVDSFRFVDFMTRKVVEGWITKEERAAKEAEGDSMDPSRPTPRANAAFPLSVPGALH